jgi:hypothetical protein
LNKRASAKRKAFQARPSFANAMIPWLKALAQAAHRHEPDATAGWCIAPSPTVDPRAR